MPPVTDSASAPPPENLATALAIEAPAAKLKAVRQQLVILSLQQTPSHLSESQQKSVREALLWFNNISEYQTLGICADTISAAEPALKSYVAALSQPINVDLPMEQPGPVFLKFNTLKNAWYLDGYSGDARGVLVTYHTGESLNGEPDLEAVNGTYGPFPLDLFSAVDC
ncbi:MAG: DUF1824 family protein [Cyanobacteria bacterium P01_D01_bin.36]